MSLRIPSVNGTGEGTDLIKMSTTMLHCLKCELKNTEANN